MPLLESCIERLIDIGSNEQKQDQMNVDTGFFNKIKKRRPKRERERERGGGGGGGRKRKKEEEERKRRK